MDCREDEEIMDEIRSACVVENIVLTLGDIMKLIDDKFRVDVNTIDRVKYWLWGKNILLAYEPEDETVFIKDSKATINIYNHGNFVLIEASTYWRDNRYGIYIVTRDNYNEFASLAIVGRYCGEPFVVNLMKCKDAHYICCFGRGCDD